MKTRIAVLLVAMVLGLTLGSSAQGPICGVEGFEFGGRYNPCFFFPEWNIGVSPSSPDPPVLWTGLVFTDLEGQDLFGFYLKAGIPGFNLVRVQYLINQWHCFEANTQYWELEAKFPFCLPNGLPSSGTLWVPYLGYQVFRLADDGRDLQQKSPLGGVTILCFSQYWSAGAWMEFSCIGIEMGFSIGCW